MDEYITLEEVMADIDEYLEERANCGSKSPEKKAALVAAKQKADDAVKAEKAPKRQFEVKKAIVKNDVRYGTEKAGKAVEKNKKALKAAATVAGAGIAGSSAVEGKKILALKEHLAEVKRQIADEKGKVKALQNKERIAKLEEKAAKIKKDIVKEGIKGGAKIAGGAAVAAAANADKIKAKLTKEDVDDMRLRVYEAFEEGAIDEDDKNLMLEYLNLDNYAESVDDDAEGAEGSEEE